VDQDPVGRPYPPFVRADPWRAVGGLAQACHPLPCLAVTAFCAAYAAVSGLAPARIALLAAAALAGQLAVGWTNDRLDAGRDAAAARRDKPLPAGRVSPSTVALAAVTALAACIVLSLALGPIPGGLHLVAVAAALAYNFGLKFGPLSPLPYVVSFGLLPVVVTTAAPGHPLPPPGVVVAAALLGAAAHFANTVPDSAADAATGVRGLPQRMGPSVSLAVTAALVCLAAAALLATAPNRGALPLGLLAAGAGLSAIGVPLAARASRLGVFRLTLLAVALVIAGFLTAAGRAGAAG